MRTLTRTIVGVEYQALRTPLALVDAALGRRLPEQSRVRRVVRGGIDKLDGLAASLLSADREPDGEPDRAPEHAPDPVAPQRSAPTRAAPERPAAQPDLEVLAEEQEQVVEAILSEEEESKHVGELAEADEQTKHDLAQLRAKHMVLELEEERRRREADA
jgi:hypothetical protein